MRLTHDVSGLTDEQIVERYGDYAGENVVALLKHDDGSFEIHKVNNLVVTTGTEYYAERIASQTPTNNFTSCYLGNPANNDSIAASDDFSDWGQGNIGGQTEKAVAATYPKLNDTDSDNTGRGPYVFTWKFEWGGGDFNTGAGNNVRTGIISSSGASGSVPILNHWNFETPFQKLATSALILWVNHTLQGTA